MSAVTVSGLVKAFGAVRAVDDVSFELPSGAVLGLLGPSGCGKTTLLRCIAGLETPDDGTIAIGQATVFAERGRVLVPPERRELGMMFQSYAIWPHMTVAENVAFGLKVRGWNAAKTARRIEEALDLVRLPGYGRRYPGELSGGQMQRVVLARCLAYHPALLLLDEPLANLDAHLREEMRAELRRIQRETGTTMVAVTHDQAEALALSDLILVMEAGRVRQAADPRALHARPASPEIARFLGAVNRLDGAARAGGLVALAGGGVVGIDHAQPAGSPVVLYLRPGDLRLGAANGDANGPLARVDSVEFLGEALRYRVLVGDRVLVVDQPLGGPEYDLGADVRIAVDGSAASCFAA
ncbi:MAG: ABC transporter ATP-binding protein [Alphaproteobacteria bacterium]|jgi:ABC-type Fe3+/spermidine/putrescine transport system ATPase subunit|nr:ABC transporter ATP-binding protein [Alphaproteobacteria bacterium]